MQWNVTATEPVIQPGFSLLNSLMVSSELEESLDTSGLLLCTWAPQALATLAISSWSVDTQTLQKHKQHNVYCHTAQPITERRPIHSPVKHLRVQRCSDHPSDQRNTCQHLDVLQRDAFTPSTGENKSSDVSWIIRVDFSSFCVGNVLKTVIIPLLHTVFTSRGH